MPHYVFLLSSLPGVPCCPYFALIFTLAFSEFGVSWSLGTLHMNVHTVRAAIGRPPQWTAFREISSPPPLRRTLLPLRICVRRLLTSTPTTHKNLHYRSVHDTPPRQLERSASRPAYLTCQLPEDRPGGRRLLRRHQRQASLLPTFENAQKQEEQEL